MRNLRRRKLDAVLLHRADHLRGWGGSAWGRLKEMRDLGAIGALGVSVVNPAEAIDALGDPDVALLQCPVNLLDHRWRQPAFLEAIARRPDVVVHARSALLQGLLTLSADRWPTNVKSDAPHVLQALVELQAEFERTDVVDLALGYVTALPWVWSVVIGCETAAQLRDNLARVARTSLKPGEVARVAARFGALPENLLDPSKWAKAS
jgi:spore coat polysaccharide biosynthesis protein SpsF